MATIRDVARESGVSVATVSYVLNDGPRPVRRETRDRVLAAMSRLEYHPSALARGMVRRRLHTLGVLFGGLEPAVVTNPYAAAVLQGIFTAAADLGFNVTLFTQPWRDARLSAAAFRDRRTDGVLVVAPFTDTDMVVGLAALGIPLIVVSSPAPAHGAPAVPWVDVDNRAGGRLAGEHLLGLGHRRIAYVGGEGGHASVPLRLEGLQDALGAAGVPLPPEYVTCGEYHAEAVEERAERLFALPTPPTAVFVGNDQMGVYLLRWAARRGLRVPGDLSVVGFDDVPLAANAVPPLTTVRQPLALLGERATHRLVKRIEADERGRRAVRRGQSSADEGPQGQAGEVGDVVAPALVVRASTGPARAAPLIWEGRKGAPDVAPNRYYT